MLTEVDANNLKTTKCHLIPYVINYKNDSINTGDETLQAISIIVAMYLWIQTEELNFSLYIYSINTVFLAFYKYI